MLEIRLTILRDRPDTEQLNKFAGKGYYLFQDKETQRYFLTQAEEGRFPRSVFWSGYDRLLNIPYDFDGAYLKAFEAEHKNLMVDTFIDEEFVIDALALSQKFSTRVLCVYSNDEGTDFAVTAEKGELVRLRFHAGVEKGKRLSDDLAKNIDTEIQATRILLDGEEPDDEGVFEWTAYEAVQTKDRTISLNPYWTFYEGEMGGQVVFKTISATPDHIAPNQFFRIAFLEFQEAFGQTPPDFTDSPEPDRYNLIDFQDPPKEPIHVKLFKGAIKSLFKLFKLATGSPKALIVTAIMSIIILGAIFGDRDRTERTTSERRFDADCAKAGGMVSGELRNQCLIDDISYRNWNLPGEIGEERPLILDIAPQKQPCSDGSENTCLVVDGEIFPYVIDRFVFKDGVAQRVVAIRTQSCNPQISDDCSAETPIFSFKQMLAVDK